MEQVPPQSPNSSLPYTNNTNTRTNIIIKYDKNNDDKKINENNAFLEWKNVNVFVNTKKKLCGKTIEKQILYNISGYVKKGELLAIMGGSGAGKSTLLNTIAGRLITSKKATVSGWLGFNKQKYKLGDSDKIKNNCAYVMQSDILPATLHVKEAFEFSAMLRLPKSMAKVEKLQRINAGITSLKLDKTIKTCIGNDAIRGVSGGEKKRVSVGIELVTDPDILYLDEPTSGLDSFTALKTLQILKNLANEGKQIIATIHQPSSEIFMLLDTLLLLAEGHCVYFGSTKNAVQYFESIGHKCPQYTNPADFLVNKIQENSQYFIDAWKKHISSNNNTFISNDIENYQIKLKPKHISRASICTQIYYLLKREIRNLQRDPRPSKIRFVQTILFALVTGALYWQLPRTQQGLRDKFGAIFFLTINSAMSGIVSTIITFPEQRILFERERDNNMYPTTLYLITKTIIQIPEAFVFTVFYCVIIYFMVGLDSKFYEFYVGLTLSMLATGSVGLIVGSFAENTGQAMNIMPVAFIPFLLFAGFLVSLDQIPSWLRWLQWIDPFRYMVDALSITEFDGVPYQTETGPNGQQIGYDNGTEYLESLGIDPNKLYFNWYMLAILFVAYRFLTWIVLVFRNGL